VVGSDECPAVAGNSSSTSSAAATAGKGKRKGKGAAASAAAAAAPAGYNVSKLQPMPAAASKAEAERRSQRMMETLLLSPAEGYAVQLLDEGGAKVVLLSRIAAADLKVLLQQPQPDQLLERVYQHFKQLQEKQQQQQQQQQANGSSGQQHGPAGQITIRPCDLLPEAAAEFERALQAAAPAIMPAAWQESTSWVELEEHYVMSDKHVMVRSLGDRRAHFRRSRLTAQRATQQEATAAQRRQENWPGEVVHQTQHQQQQQGEQQQQQQAGQVWPSPQRQPEDFWPPSPEQQQQQQVHAGVDSAAGHSSANGPPVMSNGPHAHHPGMMGEVAAALQQQQQQQMLTKQEGQWEQSQQVQWQQQQQQQQMPGGYPAEAYQQQQQQQPGMHYDMPPPHMQQQQQFMPPHMQPLSVQQQQEEQQQRRKIGPNELTPAAAAAFEACLPPGMLPVDWRQMNSWFSLDARVKFTINGTEPEKVQETKQVYDTLKQNALAMTAAEVLRQAGMPPAAQQLQPLPGLGMPAAAMPVAQPTSVYVTGLAGNRLQQQQQQQQPAWAGQAGHPAAVQGYSQQQQQQPHSAGAAGDEADDDDLDEMLGLLNVSK
jgi:hypothetical protein